MLREDIRGICHRPCIYNDEGRCDMWDELSVPDESEKCDNQKMFNSFGLGINHKMEV